MKSLKRLSVFLLLIVNLFLIANVFVVAETDDGLFAGANWVVSEVKETNVLPYGVKHSLVQGQTSTSMSGYDADGFGGEDAKVVPGQLYDQQVNVMEVPSNENVRITTWANLGGHKWTLTTVKGLAQDYEAKNPGWKVIAAINGDFFDISARGALPYQTSGALVSNGEFYKTTTGNLVGFRNDGSTDSLIGNEKVERTEKMILSVYNSDNEIIKEFDIDKVNTEPGVGESAVFYASYVNVPLEVEEGEEPKFDKVLVEMPVALEGYYVDFAELALPNNTNDFYGRGIITSTEPKTLREGQFAIVTNNDEVKQYLDEDVKIRVQYKYVGAYEGVNDISGGGTTIMKNGADSGSGIGDRAPRTVIGKKADGTIIMMVIDGRQSHIGMYGADRTELGAIMNYYGAVEAYNLDGGGSSTMIIKRDGEFQVMNSPSDGRERTDANAILIVAKDPEIESSVVNKVDSLELSVDVINTNDHDIKELYVILNGESKLVVDGKVKFENLNSNTNYSYVFEYKDSNDEMTRIISSGVIKTLKQTPVFLGVEVIERVDKFEIKILLDDPDGASTLDIAGLTINDRPFGYFVQGTKNISKTNVTEIELIKISAFVNIGDGNNTRVIYEINDFELITGLDVYISEALIIQSEYIAGVYN